MLFIYLILLSHIQILYLSLYIAKFDSFKHKYNRGAKLDPLRKK